MLATLDAQPASPSSKGTEDNTLQCALLGGLIEMLSEANDECSRTFACLALNNFACFSDNALWLGRHPGALEGLVSMLYATSDDAQQCDPVIVPYRFPFVIA